MISVCFVVFFGRYASELAKLVTLPDPNGQCTRYGYVDRLPDLPVNMLRF